MDICIEIMRGVRCSECKNSGSGVAFHHIQPCHAKVNANTNANANANANARPPGLHSFSVTEIP